MRTPLHLAGAFGCAATIVMAGCASDSSVATLPGPATSTPNARAEALLGVKHFGFNPNGSYVVQRRF